ncbi:hypothetical protein [Stenoxybacter acetivorans]|nr:hypothetical protein [Stenoxybacter acetivorans]
MHSQKSLVTWADERTTDIDDVWFTTNLAHTHHIGQCVLRIDQNLV